MFQFLFCLNMFETCLCLLHIGSCLQRLYFISIEFWLQWWVGGFNSFVELLVAMRRAQWNSGQPVQKGQKAVTSSQCRCTTWYWTGFAFLAGFTCGAFTLIIVIFFYLLLSDWFQSSTRFYRLSNPMGVDVEIADTVADTDDVADEGNGFPVSENVLHQHGTQPFEHGSFGQVDFRLERDATVPDSMGAAASDPISQFGTLVSDPISQFSLSGYMHGAEPFDIDLADGEKNLDEWSVCGSGIDESINRLNLRRALGSQHDDVHSAGASEPGGGAATSDDSVVREKMPNLNHEAAMQAFNNSLNVSAPKFMWETDSFLSAVFNSDGSIVDQLFKPVSLKRPAPCFVDLSNDSMDKTPLAKALRSGAVKPIYLGSFSRASSENENSKRKSFLFGWVTLVLINCSAFSVLDDALSDVDQPSRDIVMRCLAECFAAKATSTLGKRLGAMSKYAAHCESKSLQAFPLSERSLYSYLSALHDDPKSSASVGKSFLEAVRFSAAMIGLHGLDKECLSVFQGLPSCWQSVHHVWNRLHLWLCSRLPFWKRRAARRMLCRTESWSEAYCWCFTVVQGLRTCPGLLSWSLTECNQMVRAWTNMRLLGSLKPVPSTQRVQDRSPTRGRSYLLLLQWLECQSGDGGIRTFRPERPWEFRWKAAWLIHFCAALTTRDCHLKTLCKLQKWGDTFAMCWMWFMQVWMRSEAIHWRWQHWAGWRKLGAAFQCAGAWVTTWTQAQGAPQSTHEMPWHPHWGNCVAWCNSLHRSSSFLTTPEVGASKQRFRQHPQPGHSRTAMASPMSPTKCLFQSAWWVTRMILTQTLHRMLERFRIRSH